MFRVFFVLMVLLASAGSANAQNYGAIAFSPTTGATGYSYDYGSRAQAQRRALSECRARSGGCRIAVWFKDACGALAIGNSGWGSGWGSSRRRAEYEALKVCRRNSRGCGVRGWVCNTR